MHTYFDTSDKLVPQLLLSRGVAHFREFQSHWQMPSRCVEDFTWDDRPVTMWFGEGGACSDELI